ncbi:unnamed protein product, partial [Didymodactylos carnosus]
TKTELIIDADTAEDQNDFIEADFGPNQEDDGQQSDQDITSDQEEDNSGEHNDVFSEHEENSNNDHQLQPPQQQPAVEESIDEDEDQGFGFEDMNELQVQDESDDSESSSSDNEHEENIHHQLDNVVVCCKYDTNKIILHRSLSDSNLTLRRVQQHYLSLELLPTTIKTITSQYRKIEHLIDERYEQQTTSSYISTKNEQQKDYNQVMDNVNTLQMYARAKKSLHWSIKLTFHFFYFIDTLLLLKQW